MKPEMFRARPASSLRRTSVRATAFFLPLILAAAFLNIGQTQCSCNDSSCVVPPAPAAPMAVTNGPGVARVNLSVTIPTIAEPSMVRFLRDGAQVGQSATIAPDYDTATFIDNSGIEPGGTYLYSASYYALPNGVLSATSATTEVTVPRYAAPAAPTATPIPGTTSAEVIAPALGYTTANLYRDGILVASATVGGNTTEVTFTDSYLDVGTPHIYHTSYTVNGIWESEPSEPTEVTIPAATVSCGANHGVQLPVSGSALVYRDGYAVDLRSTGVDFGVLPGITYSYSYEVNGGAQQIDVDVAIPAGCEPTFPFAADHVGLTGGPNLADGNFDVAFIPVYWSNGPIPLFPALDADPTPGVYNNSLEEHIFEDSRGIAAYVLEGSLGQVQVTGTAFDWVEIPGSLPEDGFQAWGMAKSRARNPALSGIDYVHGDYEHEVIMTYGAPPPGLGALGESMVHVGYTGLEDHSVVPKNMTMGFAHETVGHGHGLGDGSAAFLKCPGGQVPLGIELDGLPILGYPEVDGCIYHAYGDHHDPMGQLHQFRMFNAQNRIRLGWLDPSATSVADFEGSPYYWVGAMHQETYPKKALYVPIPDGVFIVDYDSRDPNHFDGFDTCPECTPPTTGHMVSPGNQVQLRYSKTPYIGATALLMNEHGHYVLIPGASPTYVDPVRRVTISIAAQNDDGVLIQVTKP